MFGSFLYTVHCAVLAADFGDPFFGQTANRADGAVGIGGNNVGGGSGGDSYAGWRHPSAFRRNSHSHSAWYGVRALFPFS